VTGSNVEDGVARALAYFGVAEAIR
jgi:hypothetical protein